MARVKMTLTCKKCGKEFYHIKRDLSNNKAASYYEEWARENINTCRECYMADLEEKKKKEPFEYEFCVETRDKKAVGILKITSNNSYQRKEDLKNYGFVYNDCWEYIFEANSFEDMQEKCKNEIRKLKITFPGTKGSTKVTNRKVYELFE